MSALEIVLFCVDGPNSVENQLVEALENAENDKWGAVGGDGLRYLGERTAYYRDFFQVIALGRKKNYSAVLNPLRKGESMRFLQLQ